MPQKHLPSEIVLGTCRAYAEAAVMPMMAGHAAPRSDCDLNPIAITITLVSA
jgi:hypothetical protein